MDRSMMRGCGAYILVLSAALVAGCHSAVPPNPAAAAYGGVKLGMPLAEAQKEAGGEGEVREYDKLPTTIKPRDVYSKLPAETEWRIWSGEGKPTLVLGVLNDKVVFKEASYYDGTSIKGESWALPEYQR